MSILGSIVSDLAKAGHAVQSFVEKIGDDAPAVVQNVTNDANKIIPVIEAFVPGSTSAITLAQVLLDKAAQVVEDAGTAAAGSGLNVSLDQALVNEIKAVIAAAKTHAGVAGASTPFVPATATHPLPAAAQSK
jgi:hypothetical protein